MTEHTPYIDFENLPAPSEGFLVTLFITVRSVARSRAFYSEVLGGQVVLEENPCMVKLSNSWVIMNPGGGPTPDKPDISVVDYEFDNTLSTFMNLRVADIQACYEEWSSKGAEFVTPPIDRGAEIRCYMRDPDGYLIEVGQSTGLLKGSSPRSGPRICQARQRRMASVKASPRSTRSRRRAGSVLAACWTSRRRSRSAWPRGAPSASRCRWRLTASGRRPMTVRTRSASSRNRTRRGCPSWCRSGTGG